MSLKVRSYRNQGASQSHCWTEVEPSLKVVVSSGHFVQITSPIVSCRFLQQANFGHPNFGVWSSTQKLMVMVPHAMWKEWVVNNMISFEKRIYISTGRRSFAHTLPKMLKSESPHSCLEFTLTAGFTNLLRQVEAISNAAPTIVLT